MKRQVTHLGGPGGGNFPTVSIKRLGAKSGNVLDRLEINGLEHGGGGGEYRPDDLVLENDEYIKEVTVRYGDAGAVVVHEICCTTNHDKSWNTGGPIVNQQGIIKTLTNIRVLGIGGNAGTYIDSLTIDYLDNYDPTQTEDVKLFGIVSIIPEGVTRTYSSSEKVRQLEASLKVQELSTEFESSVEAEYFGAEVSSRFQFGFMSREEIENELEKENTVSSKTEYKVPAGKVGIEVCTLAVLKRSNASMNNTPKETYFFVPSGELQLQSISTTDDEHSLLLNNSFIDLTKVLAFSLPWIKTREKPDNQYGFEYYYSANN